MAEQEEDQQQQQPPDMEEVNEGAEGGGGGGLNFHLANMIYRFSDNSIKAAEKLGSRLDDISNSMNNNCEEIDPNEEVDPDDAQHGQVFINDDNKRFLDYVQDKAPEIYERIADFALSLSRNVADSQKVVAVANFFDPAAYFGQTQQVNAMNSDRLIKARDRNYRLNQAQAMAFQRNLWRASTTTDGLLEHMDREVADAEQKRRYAG